MGAGGMREGGKPLRPPRRDIKTRIVRRIDRKSRTLSPAIGRQLAEEVGQLQVAPLAPEASDVVASRTVRSRRRRCAGTGERGSVSVWEPSRGMLSPASPG